MKNKKLLPCCLLFVILTILLSACTPPANNPDQPVNSSPDNDPPAPTEPTEPTEPTKPGKPSGDLVRGNIFITGMELAIMESYPIQVMLSLSGDLPTPCNTFQADVSEPNQKNEIHVDVYSLIDPEIMCIQKIEPFAENVTIPMAGAADGTYTVWVNGEPVGEFNYPGG